MVSKLSDMAKPYFMHKQFQFQPSGFLCLLREKGKKEHNSTLMMKIAQNPPVCQALELSKASISGFKPVNFNSCQPQQMKVRCRNE